MYSQGVEPGQRYAILKDDVPVQCTARRWFNWLIRGGYRQCLFKSEGIGEILIETGFVGQRRELDGPPLFWAVRISNPREHTIGRNPALFPMSAFSRAFDKSSGADTPETKLIEMVCRTPPPFMVERCFQTLPSAYTFHKLAAKQLRARERMSGKKIEKDQELLVELGSWCEQKWGWQALVARAVGVSLQMVNDWLAGRKKMTGNQALNVLAFVVRERKHDERRLRTGSRSPGGTLPPALHW
jgi:hypothetical protein